MRAVRSLFRLHGLPSLLLAFTAASSAGCMVAGEDTDTGTLLVDVEDERTFGVSWEEYRAAATPLRDGGFRAEGDLLFESEETLRLHFDALVSAEKEKLAVFRQASTGFEPTFTNAEQTDIKYCISNNFTNKSTVTSQMASATKSWEDVARVRFVYLSSQDGSCTQNNGNVHFAVMPTTDDLFGCAINKKFWNTFLQGDGCRLTPGGAFIKGVLVLNYGETITFPGVTWTGIIRHELGHVLGFRHEHPWDSPRACPETPDIASLDLTGRRLTPYDVSSVMHYPHCDGLSGVDMTISRLDGEGARSIYGMPASWYIAVDWL